jgi:uncharacterized membrane protein
MDNSGKTALGLDPKVGSLVCYLNICIPAGVIYSIIVLITDKTNKLTRFHAVQSLLWSAASVVVIVVFEIFITVVAVATQSAMVSLLALLIWVIALGFLGLGIFAGVKGNGGEVYKLPVVGDMADKWSN